MLHLVTIVLLVLLAWSLFSVVAALVLGLWLHRAGDVPTGPTTQQVRAAMRGAGRLAILPYIIESTAREQKRRRQHG